MSLPTINPSSEPLDDLKDDPAVDYSDHDPVPAAQAYVGPSSNDPLQIESDNPPAEGAERPVQLPDNQDKPERKPRSGGYAFHKPGCRCRPCSARRRQEEAIAVGAGLPAPQVPAKDVLSDTRGLAPSKMRHNVATWLKMKAVNPKVTTREVGEALGVSASTIQNSIYKARKEGWLSITDPLDEFRYGMVPKAADNLNMFLDARDRQVTLEVAKAGIFNKVAVEDGTAPQAVTVLALKVEMPPMPDGFTPTSNIKGVIVGTPISMTEVVDGKIIPD